MDRMRMAMISVLTGAAALGATATCAQARDPFAATLRARAQQQDQSPAARERRLAERHAWLQRLVGQFHATSIDSGMATMSLSSSIDFSTAPTSSASPLKYGNAECVAVGIGLDLSCLVDLKAPQAGRSVQPMRSVTAIRLTLPVPPPDELERVRDIDGSLQMGRGGTTLKWVSLQGNTATFKTECPKPAGKATFRSTSCRQQVSILARPDGTRVRITIYPQGPGAMQSTAIELHRSRNYTADQAAARRSGQ